MKKKLFVAFFTLNVLGLVNSCECPEEKYYDYTGLLVTPMTETVPEGENLNLAISQTGEYYLAQKTNWNSFATAAYATTVCEKGYDGPKYAITDISVKSDSDFSDALPAGAELNSIVKVYGNNSDGTEVFDFLDQIDAGTVNFTYMTIESRPETDKSHRFTVTFRKANDVVVEGASDEVTWE